MRKEGPFQDVQLQAHDSKVLEGPNEGGRCGMVCLWKAWAWYL